MRLYNLVLTSIASATLVACGGGGPGENPLIRPDLPDVPYHTPVKVGVAKMSTVPVSVNSVAGAFSKDLSGSGEENLIIAGRNLDPAKSPNQITIYGWSNGSLVDQTSQWLSGTDNIISGTEPDIEFGDFNNDGLVDMYVAPSTDSEVTRGSPGLVFMNNGSSFTRSNLNTGNLWAHDSIVRDFDGDGNSDIFNTDFGNDSSLSISNGDGTFTTYMNDINGGSQFWTAASVSAADFLGNGTTSIIVTDAQTNGIQDQTRLLTYSLDSNTNTMVLSTAKVLPIPRFDLPAYAQYDQYNNTNQPKSHTIRSFAFDFDNSGIPSAVLITATNWMVRDHIPEKSEIQFLKNDGAGNFTDVTDSVLVNYNKMTQPDYNPQLLDINGDGLTDIFLGGETWQNDITNTAVLVHTAEHKYVYSYAEVFTAFQNQVLDAEKLISGNWVAGGGQTSIIKGPDNTFYMVSMLSVTNPTTGNQEKAVYLSKMGAQTPTAQATAAAIKQAWPYLSDGAVNELLATTSTQTFGLNEINTDKIFNPIGTLGLPGSNIRFNGWISGVNMDGVKPIVVDSFNRSFSMNIPSIDTQNTWMNNLTEMDQSTRGTTSMNMAEMPNGLRLGLSNDGVSFSTGLGFKINPTTQVNLQTSKLPYNQFLSMSGSWGKVNTSVTTEASVVTKKDGWVGKSGVMFTSSNITPGLVTDVSTITSFWAEGGYDFGDIKLMAGLSPKVLTGTVRANVPTSIDSSGKVMYNTMTAKVSNPTTLYMRASVDKQVYKNTTLTVNAMVTGSGQLAVKSNIKINF